jgi:acetylglutamate kinase
MDNKETTSSTDDKVINLNVDQVIQALANYLHDEGFINPNQTDGMMTYEINDDATITVKLLFGKPTMQ